MIQNKEQISKLLEYASKIDIGLDSRTQDKARLFIIKELIELGDTINAQRIIQDLYCEPSIQIAESIIDGNRNIPNFEDKSYLKFVEKQKETNKAESWNFDLRKEQIVHDINRDRKDEFYESLKQTKKSYGHNIKILKINGRALTREEKKLQKALKKEEYFNKLDQSIKGKATKITTSPPNIKFERFLCLGCTGTLREIIFKWYKLGIEAKNSKKSIRKIESFMFFWISFNAIYEAHSVTNNGDKAAWTEFIEKAEIKKIWESIHKYDEFLDFLDILNNRSVYDEYGISVQKGGLFNMKSHVLYQDWDFGNDLKKYIGTIYQIRNNLFHGGKKGDENDIDLIDKANASFAVFLEKLYTIGN